MPQGRMLSKDAFKDERFGRMSIEARLFFLHACTFLNREDVISGHPTWLAVHALSLRPEMHEQIPAMVDEWVASGLVTRRGDGMLHFTQVDWHSYPDEEDALNG